MHPLRSTTPLATSENTELPEWRTPKDPKGLALVPGGGGRAWPGFETTRRAKLAARTASGRAAAPGHQHANKQENTSSTDGERSARGAADGKRAARSAADGKRAARSAADGKRVARSAADGKRVARGAGFETTRRAKLTARTPSGQLTARTASGQLTARTASRRAKPTARGADAEQAGRRPRAPTRRTRAYNEAGTRRAKQRRGPRPRETVRPGGPP